MACMKQARACEWLVGVVLPGSTYRRSHSFLFVAQFILLVRRSRPLSWISNILNAGSNAECKPIYYFISLRAYRAGEDQLPFDSLSGIANTCQVPSVLSTMHCGVSMYPAPLQAASVGLVVVAFRWRRNNPDRWRDDPSRVLLSYCAARRIGEQRAGVLRVNRPKIEATKNDARFQPNFLIPSLARSHILEQARSPVCMCRISGHRATR